MPSARKMTPFFYARKSRDVKHVINEKLFDRARGNYRDGENSNHASLHANMFPLAFDLVPKEYVQSVLNFVQARGMACSVYGAQYLLEGLYRQHQSKYALQLMTDSTHDRTWWNMIRHGGTMTWEAWDIKYKPNLDWNHAWGSAPLNMITRYLWGIRPAKAGFASVVIEPQLGELEFSTIRVPTKRGVVRAEYKRTKSGSKSFAVYLPNHLTGEFVVRDRGRKIYLNRKKIRSAINVVRLTEGVNIIEVK